MKILNVKQGSPEWAAARLGIPTASQFSRIVTPKGKLSEASHGYLCELLAERLLGVPLDSASTGFMERGSALEAEAILYYELQRGVDTDKAGFVLTDDGRAGCSPDRLIGPDGGMELKCPSPAVHVSYLLGDFAAKHAPQVQGGMWIAEREWWDMESYSPEMPPEVMGAIVRVPRDDEYIALLSESVMAFCDRLDEATERLSALTGRAAA